MTRCLLGCPTANTANGQAMMTDHIHKVAGHFAGKLYSWDVVNEVLDPASHRPDGLRDTLWLENCGVDYMEQAFRATAAADPALCWSGTRIISSSRTALAPPSVRPCSTCSTACWRAAFLSMVSAWKRICGLIRRAALGDASYEAFLGRVGATRNENFRHRAGRAGCDLTSRCRSTGSGGGPNIQAIS